MDITMLIGIEDAVSIKGSIRKIVTKSGIMSLQVQFLLLEVQGVALSPGDVNSR